MVGHREHVRLVVGENLILVLVGVPVVLAVPSDRAAHLRTLRHDVESLSDLGYPVHLVKGPDGGYRFGSGGLLPPLLLDEEQAVAVAIALRTAPLRVAGIGDTNPARC